MLRNVCVYISANTRIMYILIKIQTFYFTDKTLHRGNYDCLLCDDLHYYLSIFHTNDVGRDHCLVSFSQHQLMSPLG